MFVPVKSPSQMEMIARLARAIWSEHYIPIIGKDQTDYMVEKFQSAKAVRRQIEQEAFHYFLIIPNKKAIGYLAVQPRENDLFLSKIYVECAGRGNGFGRAALQFTEQLAQKFGKPTVTLTVNRNNRASIAAYERCGFRIIDEVVAEIGSGFVMDDYVMQKPAEAITAHPEEK